MELVEGHPNRMTYIGADLTNWHLELLTFLKENLDVFTWTLVNILGINLVVITHYLSIDPAIKPIQQKRRAYDKVRLEEMIAEVKKLLEAGVIKELQYST